VEAFARDPERLGGARLVVAVLAERHGFWIVSDEVYSATATDGRIPSLGARLPGQVLTVSSLSKTHAMTGWRCGWVVGPPAFVEHADLLAQCMIYGLPGFIQEAALVAVGMRHSAELEVRTFCRARRDAFHAALKDVAAARPLLPDAGMFMLLDIRASGLTAAEFVLGLYEAEGVSVLDGAVFGDETKDFVRVCFATDEASLLDAARRIRRFAATLTPAG